MLVLVSVAGSAGRRGPADVAAAVAISSSSVTPTSTGRGGRSRGRRCSRSGRRRSSRLPRSPPRRRRRCPRSRRSRPASSPRRPEREVVGGRVGLGLVDLGGSRRRRRTRPGRRSGARPSSSEDVRRRRRGDQADLHRRRFARRAWCRRPRAAACSSAWRACPGRARLGLVHRGGVDLLAARLAYAAIAVLAAAVLQKGDGSRRGPSSSPGRGPEGLVEGSRCSSEVSATVLIEPKRIADIAGAPWVLGVTRPAPLRRVLQRSVEVTIQIPQHTVEVCASGLFATGRAPVIAGRSRRLG